MTSVARYAYAIFAWAFLLGLVVQVFLAGLGMFAGGQNFRLHADLGWALHLAPILILAAAVASRSGRAHWAFALALAIVVFLVPIFVLVRSDMPVIAALHPLAAVLSFGLAVIVARNSLLPLRNSAAAVSARL